jgi:hypothetical protein
MGSASVSVQLVSQHTTMSGAALYAVTSDCLFALPVCLFKTAKEHDPCLACMGSPTVSRPIVIGENIPHLKNAWEREGHGANLASLWLCLQPRKSSLGFLNSSFRHFRLCKIYPLDTIFPQDSQPFCQPAESAFSSSQIPFSR